MPRAIVLGAGLAGLSAALRLADSGAAVTVIERTMRAGGRVRMIDPGGGRAPLDCGQHLMLGCYRRTLNFVSRLGTTRLLRRIEGETPFVTDDGRAHPYRVGKLPAPFHTLPALAGLTHIGLRDRLKLGIVAASAGLTAGKRGAVLDEKSAASWLRECRQGEGAMSGFWKPLVLATLNTPPEEASALLLATVISRGFLSGADDATPVLPKTTLHELLVRPALAALSARNAVVEFGQNVTRLEDDGRGGLRALHTAAGRRFESDIFVLAVPSWDAAALRGDGVWSPVAGNAAALGSSPIVTVNLWFDRPWMRHEMAGLVGGRMQWVFPRDHRVSMVVSAADASMAGGNRALADLGLSECRRYFPEARSERLLSSLVLKAPKATFRARTGQDALRSACRSPWRNVRLAGDWTATGLPATIEGAIESGERAADGVLGSV